MVDMDGTLVFRGRALNYPTDQLPPNSMNATDTGYGSYFEGRPVYFNMFRKNILFGFVMAHLNS